MHFDDGETRRERFIHLTDLMAQGETLGGNTGIVAPPALGVDLFVWGGDPVLLDDEGRRSGEHAASPGWAESCADLQVRRALPCIKEVKWHVHPGTGARVKVGKEFREVRGDLQPFEGAAVVEGCPDPTFPAAVHAENHGERCSVPAEKQVA